MSLVLELRVLCLRIASTPAEQLPRITPTLIRDVLKCHGALSPQATNTKSENSEAAVLVHKLKTQVSTLLYGKGAEGKFTAAALIKAIVDTGGIAILTGVEPWVRGLLAILGKPDSLATKRLCILTLTDIYLMTHQSQTLTREITTPSLPTFVSSCLNLVSSKSSGKVLGTSPYLKETIFEAFCTLIPNHPAIFRPFNSQIKLIAKQYLAPASCDNSFVPLPLKQSAHRLHVLLHQTAARNTSGEEWGKAVRSLVRDIQDNVDHVYRAVIEDRDSTVSYVGRTIDVNQPPGRDSGPDDATLAWVGIDAGIERLVGQLELLAEFLRSRTATSVTIPLAHISDLLARLMSVGPPKNPKDESSQRGMRSNPAIDRDEREGLWVGLPHIHIATMNVYSVLAERLLDGFMSAAQSCLEQLVWTFTSGGLLSEFRLAAYNLLIKILPICGSSLLKPAVESMDQVILVCCEDLQLAKGPPSDSFPTTGIMFNSRSSLKASSVNADVISGNLTLRSKAATDENSGVLMKASKLLPLFISDIPQQHLKGHLRVEIDRTAIIVRHKEAMLASVLNPYVRRSGRPFPSILPHLCRVDNGDLVVESLLRPRMPTVQQAQAQFEDSEEDGDLTHESGQTADSISNHTRQQDMEGVVEGEANLELINQVHTNMMDRKEEQHINSKVASRMELERPSQAKNLWAQPGPTPEVLAQSRPDPLVRIDCTTPTDMAVEENEDSDDSDTSVHLVMDLSESEAENET